MNKTTINQTILDDFTFNLKKVKYKNKIQDLKLELCNDKNGEYIYLALIKIKKNIRCNGYGSLIMSELINLANIYNIRIILYASDLYCSDLNRLYEFYIKHGFFLIKKENDGQMIYNPKNVHMLNTIVQI